MVPRVNNAKKRWGWCYDAKYKIIRYHIITNLMTCHTCFWIPNSPLLIFVCGLPSTLSIGTFLQEWFFSQSVSCLATDSGLVNFTWIVAISEIFVSTQACRSAPTYLLNTAYVTQHPTSATYNIHRKLVMTHVVSF